MKNNRFLLSILALLFLATSAFGADQRIQATEKMVGANHATLSDTLNRLSLVEHNNDGTHKKVTLGITNPIVLQDVSGTIGRRLSVEGSNTAGGEIQVLPGATNNPAASIASQITLFNKTGTDYERLGFNCVNNQYIIDSTSNNAGIIRNIYFQMGGQVTPSVPGQNAITLLSDASVEINAATWTAYSKTWGVTRTTFTDKGDSGNAGIIIDTRSTTPASNIADYSFIRFARGGSAKWNIGLNYAGGNVDSFDFWNGSTNVLQVKSTGVVVTGTITVGTSQIISGTGTPEGAVTAPVGSMFLRTNGGANTTLYIKESGADNTGWVAK